MGRGASTALAAGLFTDEVERMLRDMGYAVRVARDGAAALAICGSDAPMTVVADAILPVLDGFSLAGRIRASGAVRIPGIVVTHFPGMGRNADLPGVAALEKPLDAGRLAAAIGSVAVSERTPTADMRLRIMRTLDELGVPDHPGRDYLADAAFLAGEDETLLSRLTTGLYPMVARRCGTDGDAVERAMRRAIEVAWRYGSIEKQYEIFKNTIDAARGKPTCGGMIAQLAEMLRREG